MSVRIVIQPIPLAKAAALRAVPLLGIFNLKHVRNVVLLYETLKTLAQTAMQNYRQCDSQESN